MDVQKPMATALAVKDGKFIAVGRDADMEPIKAGNDGTRIIDAQGRTVIPGLNDSHLARGPRRALLQPGTALGRR